MVDGICISYGRFILTGLLAIALGVLCTYIITKVYSAFYKSSDTKVAKPEQRYYFEPDQVEKLAYLYDKANSGINTMLNRYKLWKYVKECFPELDLTGEKWYLNIYQVPLTPYLLHVENDKEDNE